MKRRHFLKGIGVAALGTVVPGRGDRFRSLLAARKPLMCPGVYDVVSARLAEDVGFEALVVGGSACAASMYGLPDYGLVSITELIELSGRIAQSVGVPILADADDGGGSPPNVYRAVRDFERVGVAAVMIEDHVQVKHVGEGGALVSKEAMSDRIKAAVDGRLDRDFVIVARADSVSIGESIEQAMERGAAYAQAGADVLFFAGMPLEDCRRAAALGLPLMTTVNDTPLDELERNGIALAVYAGQAIQLALGAAYNGLKELKANARITDASERSIPRDVYARLLRSEEHRSRANRYRHG